MSSRYQRLNTVEDHHTTTADIDYDAGRQREQHQRNELEDTFGECLEEEEEEEDNDDPHAVTDPLLPQNPTTTTTLSSTSTNNIPNLTTPIYIPPTTDSFSYQGPLEHDLQQQRSTVAILPVTNDGVFANMSAKPESDSTAVEEIPPTYEEAAADATPPYWPTTVIAPATFDGMILVEGLPVGGIFAFFWNLMISASFQFVGFMLTYLLHTSHASKQGSRAGLGVSLVQMGFYIRSRGTLEDDQYHYAEKSDGSQTSSRSSSSTSGTVDDSTDAAIIAYFLMMLGWFLVLRSIADYLRAKQLEKIISSESSTARSALAVTDTSAATSSTNSTTRMNQNTPENMV